VRKVEVNVRIVAATNRNIDSVVGDGTFRADLLYRINSFQIHLAPLRERPEDVEPLMHYILKQLGGANPPEVTADALGRMRAYAWPGNVRQLRNCLERAILLSNEGRITSSELPPEVARSTNCAAPFTAGVSSAPVSSVDGSVLMSGGDGGSAPGSGSLRDVEKQQIIAALEQTGWHRGKAAEMLGISPSTLYRRLRDYNLEGRLR
jgi:DNA-binding NtrC family response regulator